MNEQFIDNIVELSEPQAAIMESRSALTLEMAGQGGGKTKTIGYRSGMFVSDFPKARGFIGANTDKQLSQSTLAGVFSTWAKDFGFSEYDAKGNPAGTYVVDKKPPSHFIRHHQLRDYSGTISFYHGCLVFIGSLENYKAHDGKEFGWAELDETKDTRPTALKEVILGRLRQYGIWYHKDTKDLFWDEVVRPAEAEARGWIAWNPICIHTSPALGGVEWLNELFKLRNFSKEIKAAVNQEERAFFHRQFENKTVVIYPVHFNRHNLPPNYIENQKLAQGDDDGIQRIVNGYPFAKMGGEWYPSFNRDKVVSPQRYNGLDPVHSTWDFNAVPYMTDLNATVGYEARYIDAVGNKFLEPAPGLKYLEVLAIRFYKEYCLEGERASTEAVCDAFKEDHPPGPGLFYYGDASGNSRIPGLGSLTNYKIIEAALADYIHNGSKCVTIPNMGIWIRRDLLNRIFSGKIPEVEIYIDPSCVKLIEDCENVKTGPKGKVKEKLANNGGQKYGHPTDAMEYMVCYLCKDFIV